MKFVCDKCSTRYSIADERVRGRVLKIRCKSCDHVITVREDASPSVPVSLKHSPHSMQEALDESFGDGNEGGGEHTMVSSGLPGMVTNAPPELLDETNDEWYVSFDGDQEGPYPIEKACERVRVEQPRGKEVHCWRPGFFVWLPVEEVPEFSPALKPARPAARPPALPPLPAARPATQKTATQAGSRPKRDPAAPVRKEPTPLASKAVVHKDPRCRRRWARHSRPVPSRATSIASRTTWAVRLRRSAPRRSPTRRRRSRRSVR